MAGYWSMLQSAPGIDSSGMINAFFAAQNAARQKKEGQLAEEWRKKQLERQKTIDESDKIKMDSEKKQNIEKATAEVVGRLAQMSPENRKLAMPYVQKMVDAGKIMMPDLGQVDIAAPLEGAVYGVKQQMPEIPETITNEIAKDVMLESNLMLKPGMPGFNEAYQKAKERRAAQEIARARASRSQINVGGKQLPTANVTDIADADSALESVDILLESFKENVPSEGVVQEIGSRIISKIPNTDVNVYNTERNIATQVVGSFLEGGVLKEQDFKRYSAMMPSPGDSAETAQKKAANLKKMISARTSRRRQQLGSAGYNVPPTEQPKPIKQNTIADQMDAAVEDLISKGVPLEQAKEQVMRQMGKK